jgi:hypothetical protein
MGWFRENAPNRPKFLISSARMVALSFGRANAILDLKSALPIYKQLALFHRDCQIATRGAGLSCESDA